MNLSKEQLDAIQKGASVPLSENGTDVVVVRADVFDRLREKAGLDQEGEEARILGEIAELPELPRERLHELAKKRTPPQEWFEEKDDLLGRHDYDLPIIWHDAVEFDMAAGASGRDTTPSGALPQPKLQTAKRESRKSKQVKPKRKSRGEA